MTVPEFDIHLTDLATGKAHRLTHWSEYSLTTDLMSPGSTFSATLAAVEHQRAFTAHGGQKAQVFSHGALQATAWTDERSEATNADSTDLIISGRGAGGLLLDSVVPADKLSMLNLTLARVVERITEHLQPDFVTSIAYDNSANRYMVAGKNPSYATKAGIKKIVTKDANGKVIGIREVPTVGKVRVKGSSKPFGVKSPEYRGLTTDFIKQAKIKPDEKIWDVISKLCKQVAIHPHVGCDNSIIMTRPAYDFDSTAYGEGLVQKWDRKLGRATGGNIAGSQFETSIATRNSEIVAWATSKPKKTTKGKALLKHTWAVKDPSPAFWERLPAPPWLGRCLFPKPTRVVLKSIAGVKMVRRRCRSMFEEAAIKAFSLEYKINGHHINGQLPVVDSMINLHDERYGLIGTPYYIVKVERRMSQSAGRSTTLRLIPPKIWLYFDHDTVGDEEYLEHMVQRVFW